jgi:site-specific recombinase XerD
LAQWFEGREEYFKNHEHDKQAVFIALKGRWLGGRIGNSGVCSFMKHWSLEAKLQRVVNAHSFRHHKGHDIIHKGGSAADVSNILGHANISSSHIYMMMSDKELKDRADKFLDK